MVKLIRSQMRIPGSICKILREVIRVRKQDQQERDELETLLEVYLQAIKGAFPVARAAAKAAAKAA